VTLSLSRIETESEWQALAEPWARLEKASDNRLPFRTFDWVDSWWRHFAENKRSVRDVLAARVVHDASGELVGAFPLMLTQRPNVGPFAVRLLQFFGADPNITEIRGPLLHPVHEQAAVAVLAADVRKGDAAHHWMEWAGLRVGSAGEAALAAEPSFQWTREIPNYVLTLAESWDELRKRLKHNIRESLRKCYNSLKRDNHSFSFDVVERPDDVPAALEHFFRLHAMRAEVEGTIRHRNVFDSPVARAFLVDVTQRFARRGATRIFTLSFSGKVVALRIGYVLGDSIYMYYSGYDPAWGKYSIMTTVVAEALKYAIAHGLQTANLSTGNDISKTRWGPSETVYREAAQVAPSFRGQLAHQGYQLAMRARSNPRVRAALGGYLGRRQ
jgi:CelD/BcsL family acetyltransferase involved in cellulose biosynthesis